jgi:hypothetical protein
VLRAGCTGRARQQIAACVDVCAGAGHVDVCAEYMRCRRMRIACADALASLMLASHAGIAWARIAADSAPQAPSSCAMCAPACRARSSTPSRCPWPSRSNSRSSHSCSWRSSPFASQARCRARCCACSRRCRRASRTTSSLSTSSRPSCRGCAR